MQIPVHNLAAKIFYMPSMNKQAIHLLHERLVTFIEGQLNEGYSLVAIIDFALRMIEEDGFALEIVTADWFKDLLSQMQNKPDLEAWLKSEEKKKEGFHVAIEQMEALGSKEGILLARGFRSLENNMHEEAIKAFDEVLSLHSLGMKSKDSEAFVSFALLGLICSYSGINQIDKAKEYLEILDRINADMAEEFRETWRKSPIVLPY